MAEKSNAALLYEIIDTLTDEEFKELLDTLAIPADKVEDEKEEVVTEKEEVDERVKAIQERLEALRRKRKIQPEHSSMPRHHRIPKVTKNGYLDSTGVAEVPYILPTFDLYQ
jgi:FtsZ-binding cell division protein ZapB